MKRLIKKRIELFALIVFFTVVIFSGVSKTTNAETLNGNRSTVESNYNFGIDNAGKIVVLATKTSENTTGSSIKLVISDVSDEDPVPVGTVVHLSQTTTGGAIIYSTNGTEPKINTSLIYKGGIVIKDDVTIKARVYEEYTYGEIVQFDYKVVKGDQVEPVKTNIPVGSVTTGTCIELSTITTGAAIYYEIEELDFIDTTTPQAIKYNEPIKIESSKKITTYAVKEGYMDSIKSEFIYTIDNQIVIEREFDNEVIAGEFADFKINVSNKLNESKSVSLVMAVYDKKNRMIDYIYVSDLLKPKEATKIQSGLKVSESGSYIKCYIIDSLDGIKPVSNTIKILIKDKL